VAAGDQPRRLGGAGSGRSPLDLRAGRRPLAVELHGLEHRLDIGRRCAVAQQGAGTRRERRGQLREPGAMRRRGVLERELVRRAARPLGAGQELALVVAAHGRQRHGDQELGGRRRLERARQDIAEVPDRVDALARDVLEHRRQGQRLPWISEISATRMKSRYHRARGPRRHSRPSPRRVHPLTRRAELAG